MQISRRDTDEIPPIAKSALSSTIVPLRPRNDTELRPRVYADARGRQWFAAPVPDDLTAAAFEASDRNGSGGGSGIVFPNR